MKKRFVAMILIAFAAIIFLPPIIHGYVYPTLGQDTATHEEVFDKIKIGSPIPSFYGAGTNIRYSGYYLIGYPLDLINRITNISKDTLFFWFNYIALFGVGVSLFYIFKNLLGIYAGLLALFIPVFTSYAILLLYYSGTIFNFINMGIILPFIIYFVIKALTQKGYWIGVFVLGIVFATFHSSGAYLPFYAVVGYLVNLLYKLIRKQVIPKKEIIIGVILISASILFVVINPLRVNFENDGAFGLLLLQKSLFYYMSVSLTLVILSCVVLVIIKWKAVLPKEKLVLSIFGIATVMLLPAILFGWSPQPFRQGLDMAIILSMVAVILISIIIRLDKRRLVTILVLALIIGGSYVNMKNWLVSYSSAINEVDIEAINYVNSLQINSYSASHNIDHVIYGRFLYKKYLSVKGDIVIVRSEPMKSSGILPEQDISLDFRKEIQEFSDGKITIGIYQ
jgi:hypothetical protein